ncbi:unnamed protein product [Brassica rapa]|uniref:Uncharacterized protein n=1 Tax=Brassica campestris TaxID=3711 RepID=A0A3P5ZME0_BRACM|nr:unnamed protein product [Brassica rapa]VDC81182.1 unnamed protein product [Brassica rapa]
MGSCVSSSHNTIKTSSDSAVKLSALISEPDTTSPVKNDVTNPATINGNSFIDSTPRDSSEEITFFDSRGWLDSDCEDDFMSVDGEFTPSRGTTPVHHKFSDKTPEADEKKHEEPSPTDNKKRLLELFKETQDQDEDEGEDDVAESKARACLWLRTPVRSSAPATPYNNNNDTERQQLKRVKSSAQGSCVLRLVSCSSFTERRRKMMNHTPVHVQR